MRLETLIVGAHRTNCYLLWNEEGDAILVDPGDEAPSIDACIENQGLAVRAILLTHAHSDHTAAVAWLQGRCGAPVWMHPADEPLFVEERPRCGFRVLHDGETFLTHPFFVQAWHLPGHSPGSVGYYLPDEALLFSGDTLFRGIVGNTEGPGANSTDLRVSLRRLLGLPSETRVLPGHGTSTTLERERHANYFLATQQPERSYP